MKRYLNPDQLFDSLQYGFSQIVIAHGGTTVYISGQVAWDESGAITGPGDLAQQTRMALENVSIAVAAAGGALSDVVSMRIYVVAEYMRDSRAIREALLEYFPANPPATTWIAVQALANEELLVEIEPVAVIHGPTGT